MAQQNPTHWQCLPLTDEQIPALYQGFMDAFSDYELPPELTLNSFRSHLIRNAVDLARSMGVFAEGRIIGFSLNGFGRWNGRSTAYDAGTGVLPQFRRQGIATTLFDQMLPMLCDEGCWQMLLEVITTNTKAVQLYQKLGFEITRELALFEAAEKVKRATPKETFTIRDSERPDWSIYESFWNVRPSWQNTPDAIEKSADTQILEVLMDGRVVGYISFARGSGRISQMAVDGAHRRRGIGTALIMELQARIGESRLPKVINWDCTDTGAIEFFKTCGFGERLRQYEMLLQL